jgi:hypothetical protein
MAARVDTPHTHTHTCLGLYIVGSKLALGHCLGRVAHCAGMYYFLIYFHRIKKKKVGWLIFNPNSRVGGRSRPPQTAVQRR